MKTINLEEILKLHYNVAERDKEEILIAMRFACWKILELAAKNVEERSWELEDINTQIILDTIKQVEKYNKS